MIDGGAKQAPKPAVRKKTLQVDAKTTANLVSSGMSMIGGTRPTVFREAWDYRPNDPKIVAVAEPLTELINTLPPKIAEQLGQFGTAISLAVAAFALYSSTVADEKVIANAISEQIRQQRGHSGTANNGHSGGTRRNNPGADDSELQKPTDLPF